MAFPEGLAGPRLVLTPDGPPNGLKLLDPLVKLWDRGAELLFGLKDGLEE